MTARVGMFNTVAVVLSSGTGWSDLAPLCAIDQALHPLQQANYHRVTSLVPAGTPVYRLRDDAEALPLDGAHVPAVLRWKTGQGSEFVSAGIGLGLPYDLSQTGVIYHEGGNYAADVCEKLLDAMVAEAMTNRGTEAWAYKSSVSCAVPEIAHPFRWRAAVAALTFLDEGLLDVYRDSLVLA